MKMDIGWDREGLVPGVEITIKDPEKNLIAQHLLKDTEIEKTVDLIA